MADRNCSWFFQSNDASLIMTAGRLHITRNLILNYVWQETRRAQARLQVTFISSFNLSSLICKSSVGLFIHLSCDCYGASETAGFSVSCIIFFQVALAAQRIVKMIKNI